MHGGQDYTYGIMFDGGSSGTRVHVFAWLTSYPQGTLPNIESAPLNSTDHWEMKGARLADIVSDPSGAGDALEPLFEYARDKLRIVGFTNNTFNEVPVFLRCTAGMRNAFENNPANTTAVLENVRDACETSGFKFNQRGDVSILPGEQEGVFGWISANYLANRANPDSNRSVLAADMGGASTQLTFEPDSIPLANAYRLSLLDTGVEKTLYTHSFLNFGQDRSRDRYLEELIKTAAIDNTVSEPCLWRGLDKNYTHTDGTTYVLKGTGMSGQCLTSVSESLLSLGTFCPTAPCSVNGVYQPTLPDDMDMYFVAGYSYSGDFFGCGGANSFGCMHDAAVVMASDMDWEELKAAHPSIDSQFLFIYLFNAMYFHSLVTEGYGIDVNTTVNFVDAVDGSSIGWVLGAMMNEVHLMQDTVPTVTNSRETAIMIDAASTHTTAWIYQWPSRLSSAEIAQVECAPLDSDQCLSYRHEQSVAAYATDLDGVTEVMTLVLAAVRDMLSSSDINIPVRKIPVYLRATAAMRMIESESPTQAEAIMERIRDCLDFDSPFSFNRDNAYIIPGNFEGALDWLSVNYLIGSLEGTLDSKNTAMALDLGSNALEISFIPPEPPLSGFYPMSLFGFPPPLYAFSFLRYGGELFRERYMADFTADVLTDREVDFPCFHTNLSMVYTNMDTGVNMTLVGTGNLPVCRASVSDLALNLDVLCPASPCSMNGVYTPVVPDEMEIYAFDGFHSIANFFNCSQHQEVGCVYESASDFCSMSWTEVQTLEQSDDSSTLIEEAYACMFGAYLDGVLIDGFGLAQDREIYYREEIRNTPLTWALGAMVYEAFSLSDDRGPRTPTDHTTLYVVAAVSVGVIIIGVAAFCYFREDPLNDPLAEKLVSNRHGAVQSDN